jgi:sugar (pentulose or hexulose) kinase
MVTFPLAEALAGPCFVGFDLGTSGARISIVEQNGLNEVFSDSIRWEAYDDADAWENVVYTLLRQAKDAMGGSLEAVQSICVSGTSASCLMVDGNGDMTRTPRMYDFDVVAQEPTFGKKALELLDKHAPPQHTARAKTSSFAKLLTWVMEKNLGEGEVLCHQADYITMKLMSEKGKPRPPISSDWHNCLKCGYDVRNLEWPGWIKDCLEEAGVQDALTKGIIPPTVVSPGQPLGFVSAKIAEEFGLPKNTALVGGTTDSNAAFFAAVGGTQAPMGTAVTSLGSTLAIKQLSNVYVEDASRGVYSHRFPNFEEDGCEMWLIGGASNVGCAVLRQQGFSDDELVELSKYIDPMSNIDLSYYPLIKKGERFPIADGEKEPLLEPVPDSRQQYLHGILQGISDVEKDGFQVLGKLGASPSRPAKVMTCGGGSKNDMWTRMRQRKLCSAFDDDDIAVERANNTEASYGAAILAAATFLQPP